ncbi:methionyl-tRNA formyltransferase, partial [Candidatus Parcubacteria bacterium]
MKTSNKQSIIFWGTPDFAVPSLKSLHELGLIKAVVTQADKPAGRGKKLLASAVKNFCLENKLVVLEPVKLDQAFIDSLKKYLPATFVVVAYGKIIPQTVLDLSVRPAVNIHPSMLPQLRGPSPIQTAILNGLESTGVSLMQLDKKMDHGPILSQIEVKIEPNEDYPSLAKRLSELGAKMLTTNIESYLAGELSPLAQDDSQATYCELIEKTAGQIDWSKSAQEINNQIRAFNPWPSAYAQLSGLDIKFFQARLAAKDLSPGKILLDKENLYIGTAKGSLEILELQVAGKKKMKTAEFIRGYQSLL